MESLYNYIMILYLIYVTKALDRRSVIYCPTYFISGAYPIHMLKWGEDQQSSPLSRSA